MDVSVIFFGQPCAVACKLARFAGGLSGRPCTFYGIGWLIHNVQCDIRILFKMLCKGAHIGHAFLAHIRVMDW